MRHPRDFTVNETWIVFGVNDAPIKTDEDGDFNVVSLMDAASCMILGFEFVSTRESEVPEPVAEQLLETGREATNLLPQKLLISSECEAAAFAGLAERKGIEVEHVPDAELKAFLKEARESFREFFGPRKRSRRR